LVFIQRIGGWENSLQIRKTFIYRKNIAGRFFLSSEQLAQPVTFFSNRAAQPAPVSFHKRVAQLALLFSSQAAHHRGQRQTSTLPVAYLDFTHHALPG
jgi:hypothetical protein